jgi:hypothetical protein
MRNQVLYPHMQNYAYGDCCTHMGIPVCIQAGIAKIFTYGDPHSHNEIVRILGATSKLLLDSFTSSPLTMVMHPPPPPCTLYPPRVRRNQYMSQR